jgi:rhodanese-related sulfurtransferase
MPSRFVLLAALFALGCGTADDGGPGQSGDFDAALPEAAEIDAAFGDTTHLDAGPEVAAEGGDPDDGGEALDALTPYRCPIELALELQTATVQELREKLVAGEELEVLDVREATETASGIIEVALLMPWTSGVLQSEHTTLPAEQPKYVVCGSGARSLAAAKFLIEQGHTCVFDVQGGMSAWNGAGYPTVLP